MGKGLQGTSVKATAAGKADAQTVDDAGVKSGGALGLPTQADLMRMLPPAPPLSAIGKAMGVRREADLRTMCIVATYYALSFLAWNNHHRMTWPMILCTYVVLSFFSFFGACAVHNTMHCRIFHDKSRNKYMQFALSLTYGHPVSSYVPGHNQSHHKYTQHPEDVMRTTKLRNEWHLLNGLFFQQTVAAAVMQNDFKYIATQSVLSHAWFTQAIREFWVVGAVTVTLFALDWRKALIYYYVPHLFAQWGIVSINIIQHDGCDVATYGAPTSGHLVESINSARNLTSPLLNFLTMNNGYHSIHHMYPTLHWSQYKLAHDMFVHPKIDPRLEVPSLADYIFKTFVYPGKRLRFDGQPIQNLDTTEPTDIEWINYPDKLGKADVEKLLAPGTLIPNILKGVVLVPFKMICPIWSPQGTLI